MTLGPRIQRRLDEIGISQAELARRVGIRQSTLNSLIKGDSRTSRSLLKIARELRTTPSFLIGESDDPGDALAAEPDLDTDSRKLLDHFVCLATDDRSALLQIAQSLAIAARLGRTV